MDNIRKQLIVFLLSVVISDSVSATRMESDFSEAGDGVSIHGTITDAGSGEYIYGANIVLKGTRFGAVSNIEGFYSVPKIVPGQYTLLITFIGYARFEKIINVQPGYSGREDVELAAKDLIGREVVVTGEKSEFEKTIKTSTVSVNPIKIKTLPQIGEVDLFRALQFLPGVMSQNDFSAGLLVRGGNTDQNLILLDGITVYNPSHLGGFFSTFITDGLREAELIKGGYTAEYGGRLSSVLDIKTKDGNNKRIAGSGEISLISSKMLIEGPIANGGWLFAARRTYIDKALDGARKLGISDFDFPYYFFDIQANIYQDLTPNDRLRISAYFGSDVLDWRAATAFIDWGNETFSTRWRHLFSNRLFSTFMIARSKFEANFNFGGDDAFIGLDKVRDWTLKADLTYFRTENHQINFGTEIKDLNVEFKQTFDERELIRIIQKPIFSAVYFNSKWNPDSWIIQSGLRSTFYNDAVDKLTFSPRLSVKKLLNPLTALNFSIGRYYQYIYTFNDEFSSFTIIDQWFAIDESVPLQFADQIMFGFETKLTENINFTLEPYYKNMHNLLVGRPQLATFDEQLINPTVSDVFVETDAEAFGVEFFLEKTSGRLNGNLSYTYSYVIKQIENEPKYWANWDRRNVFKGVLNFNKSTNTEFGFAWTYSSGLPFTQQIGTYPYWEPGYTVPEYQLIPGTRNNARLPFSNRLDCSVTKHKRFSSWKMDYYFQIVNVFNRKNIFAVFWNTDEVEKGNPAERSDLRGFPLIPTFGIRAEF